ncbi:MAG: hypothetical protein ACLR6J_12280 [Parabacteroides merdae]
MSSAIAKVVAIWSLGGLLLVLFRDAVPPDPLDEGRRMAVRAGVLVVFLHYHMFGMGMR